MKEIWFSLTTSNGNRWGRDQDEERKQGHGRQKAKCLRLRPLGLSCSILAAYLTSSHPGYFSSSCPKPSHIAEAMARYAQISLQHMMCCGRRHLIGHKHTLHFFPLSMEAALHIQQTSFHFQRGCLIHPSDAPQSPNVSKEQLSQEDLLYSLKYIHPINAMALPRILHPFYNTQI